MRAWLLCALMMYCGLQAAQCCSCPIFNDVSRTTAIQNGVCYSSMVYSARVVGVNCNCLMGNTALKCVNYTTAADSTQTAQVITMGECETAKFDTYYYNMCADLSSALGVSTTGIMQPAGLPTVNLTTEASNERCPNVCPFIVDDDDNTFERRSNPCQYTLELLEVFKPVNNSLGTTLMSFGPDVLTSCGNPARRLSIGESYLVGVGGPCSPFSEWTTLESYSESELDFLRELRISVQCGALGIVPSALTILLSALVILVLYA